VQTLADIRTYHILHGKSTSILTLVTLWTCAWPFAYNNWGLHMVTTWGHAY